MTTISLTDIAKYRTDELADVIKNWMRNRDTIEFLGLWETLNNPDFIVDEFNALRLESGRNTFVLSPKKWIEKTNAIGILSKAGIGGGTFAHKDVAFEFASWISAEFKLYIIKDYQRLKSDENSRLSLDWNLTRTLAKINYKIHTDAVQETQIPENVSKTHQAMTYASEADVLNVALFGSTAKEWRAANPGVSGNIRDHATISQLVVLSNLENLNAEFMKENISQQERLGRLNEIAIRQLRSLSQNASMEKLRTWDKEIANR
ncbi:KilA-N domain-containing protein [Methanocorpusculum sp. MG]|uniref:KilA-N domain-containing protein n=1 Tax=Methanocorpusculum petauri TaxID=3002863 RepID=A0ABT4IEG6_9EURY|nr:KilA-N domain-containing protein [Methanocorpusculum petauri]MCZ0860125.1 KilA-N domain-containing protein [Methanocorpusculum petauri]MDE2442792.1 KilA-N domain-containing protein [Methanocorpusculum sp.]